MATVPSRARAACARHCHESAQEAGAAPGPSVGAGTRSRVLLELRVENLLLIERAELRLAPGLNVLTGETGAGKTVLAHALDLLLGGRARAGIVRPGAAEAYVEGVFELPGGAARRARRAAARRRGGGRARPARERRGAHARLPLRALGGGRRPARGRRRAAVVLRPARAPQAHARLRAARRPRRLLRRRAPGAARRSSPRPTRACASSRRRWPSCASAPGRASASSTCSTSSWPRSRRPTRREAEAAELRAARERLRHLEALRAAALGAAQAAAPDEGAGRRRAAGRRRRRRSTASRASMRRSTR